MYLRVLFKEIMTIKEISGLTDPTYSDISPEGKITIIRCKLHDQGVFCVSQFDVYFDVVLAQNVMTQLDLTPTQRALLLKHVSL